ncbi:carbohydrate sulfotransferase 13-like [Amphiura filiformis]|uniref:carbohydrate sulfotransferase 13-like n=1 Tax=Amphiura filiformis TaxID=82378 RepID=UPI003B221AB9
MPKIKVIFFVCAVFASIEIFRVTLKSLTHCYTNHNGETFVFRDGSLYDMNTTDVDEHQVPNLTPSRTLDVSKDLLELSDEEFMIAQEIVQTKRKQHLQKICKQYHHETPNPLVVLNSSTDMMIDHRHRLVMCCTAKIAGTSWKRVFNVLTGLMKSTMSKQGFGSNRLARKISRIQYYKPKIASYILQNYTTFMFARNPLTRMLSAFNNKLAPNATDKLNKMNWRNYGYNMIMRYRPWSSALDRLEGESTRDPDKYDLTFHDFIKFLADDDNWQSHWNNHWIENHRFCHPCDIQYDVIGKYETLLQDAKYILKLTKVDNIVSFPESEGNANTSTHSSDQEKVIAAFKDVPIVDIERVLQRYKLDFFLFNYTFPTEIDYISKWFN